MARLRDRLPSPRAVSTESGSSGWVTPITRSPGLKRVTAAAHRHHFAGGLASQLLRQREGRPPGKLVAGEIAVPVLHVPARHRAGVILDQHVAVAQQAAGRIRRRSACPGRRTRTAGPPWSWSGIAIMHHLTLAIRRFGARISCPLPLGSCLRQAQGQALVGEGHSVLQHGGLGEGSGGPDPSPD